MIPFPILWGFVRTSNKNKSRIQYDNINKINTIKGKIKIKNIKEKNIWEVYGVFLAMLSPI